MTRTEGAEKAEGDGLKIHTKRMGRKDEEVGH